MTNENEKSLEQKLKEANEKLPGLAETLKPYSGATWGMHWNGHPEDVKYLETKNYQIAAARWDEHEWDEGGGGIQWNGWLSVHYKQKNSQGKIQGLSTQKVVTRDRYDAHKDKTHLWGHSCVGIEALDDNQIKVSWENGKGEKVLSYTVNLKTKEIDGRKVVKEE